MPNAAELLAARARRVTAIRQRVIAAVAASFVLFWGVVAWDGSMSAEPSTASTTASSATTATDSSTTTTPDDTWSGQATGTDTQPQQQQQDNGSSLQTSQS